MSTLSKLPKIVAKKAKRLGRGTGSGRGAKASRGTTRHQSAREKIPIWFEGGQNPITKKFPLLRGKGKNRSVAGQMIAVSLSRLNKLPAGSHVDIEILVKYNIVDKSAFSRGVKILSGGSLSHELTVKLPVSTGAKSRIEKAGGTVQQSPNA